MPIKYSLLHARMIMYLGAVSLGCVVCYFLYLVYFAQYQQVLLESPVSPHRKDELQGYFVASKTRSSLSDTLTQVPWIQSFRIEQIDFETIMIAITSAEPIAQLPNNKLLLSTGVAIDIPDTSEELPSLEIQASPDDYRKVVTQIEMIQKTLTHATQQAVSYIWMTGGARLLTLENGMQVMFHDADFASRLQRFSNMIQIHQDLIASESLRYFDLRYDYGIAVSRKHRKDYAQR